MSAHGVAGPRSVLTGPATRGETEPVKDAGQNAPANADGQEAQPAPPGSEPARRPDHLSVVSPRQLSPAQRRRRARFAAVVAGAFVIVVLFSLVGLHVMLAQNQFRLDRLASRAADEQARYERLRLQVDQLESPQRIVQAAKQKLGMVPPASVTYLTPSAPLPASSSSGPPGTSHPTGPGAASASTTLPAAGAPSDWSKLKSHLAANP